MIIEACKRVGDMLLEVRDARGFVIGVVFNFAGVETASGAFAGGVLATDLLVVFPMGFLAFAGTVGSGLAFGASLEVWDL